MKLKDLLKEFTDHNWEIPKVEPTRVPHLKDQVEDLIPKSLKSQKDAMKQAKAVYNDPWRKKMGRYAPVFVHVAYFYVEYHGTVYFIHNRQYYQMDGNYPEGVPIPKLSKLYITIPVDYNKEQFNPGEKDAELGSYLVMTDDWMKDLHNLKIVKRGS